MVAPLLPRLLLAAATALPLGAATDFSFEDGALLRSGSRGGRAVVVGRGDASEGPLPAVVFLHGLNDGGPIHRWLNPDAIDLRGVVAAIAESAALPPFILAAPSQTKDAGHARSLWAGFDLEAFVAAVERAYGDAYRIDRGRVVVVGHSAAGCNPDGGLLALAEGTLLPAAVVAVDTCVDDDAFVGLGALPGSVPVRVVAQTRSWPRDVGAFREQLRALRSYGSFTPDDSVDEIDEPGTAPHETIVPTALRRVLAALLRPSPPPRPPRALPAAALRPLLRAPRGR